MPHNRSRYCVTKFEKKLKFQRVVLVQGVRQCGKSFFLRELFAKGNKSCVYATLDQPSERKFATDNPESFLRKLLDRGTVIIDEAQKVPILFDTVKYFVDMDKRPGQFVLAGSTEFSIKSNIRESLTGRATSIRLFPLTLGEAQQVNGSKIRLFPSPSKKLVVSRTELLRHLEVGGMPGICFVRNAAERRELLSDWIQLTTQRDIQQLPGAKKDSSLAHDIMLQVALLDEPTAPEIAKKLRVNSRRVNSHIDGLKTLFALTELPPCKAGTGKPRLYLCDVSFASYFGADLKRQLETLYFQELLAHQAYFGDEKVSQLEYFRTSKGSIVDFVYKDSPSSFKCIKIHDRESVNQLDVRILTSLSKKLDAKTILICAAGVSRDQQINDVRISPWENVSGQI